MIFDIREYKSSDIPALTRLWSDVFGDSEALVKRFFELLPSMGTGFVAYLDKHIYGAAYALDAFLHLPDGETKKLTYIYAVAVREDARGSGMGAELSRACMRYAWESLNDICCTLPAEQSLYAWYESRCGLKAVGGCRYETVNAGAMLDGIRRLHADEYSFLREDKLKGLPHASFGYGYMLFQEAIFAELGGGFFEYNGGIACGYVEDGVLRIKEALGDSPEFIAALCKMLGAGSAEVRRAAPDGGNYMAVYRAEDYPSDTVFNITLD